MQIAQPPRQLQGLLRMQIKYIYHIYNLVERLQCEYLCIVGVKVDQSQDKITKIEAYLRTQTNNFLLNMLQELVTLGNQGKKKNRLLVFSTKVTKYGRLKLHSFETDIDAQACNNSEVPSGYTIIAFFFSIFFLCLLVIILIKLSCS